MIVQSFYFHLPIGAFHCAKLKKALQRIQIYEDASFLGPKWFIRPKQFFFWKKIINIIFIYLLARFILQNLKQIWKPIHIYEDVPLSGPKYPNWFWTKLFGTNHYYYFHLPIGPFHWAKFKKNSYSGSRVMSMHHFWAQNGPFALNNFFYGKLLKSLSSTYYPLSLYKILKKFFKGIQSCEDVQIFWVQNGPFPQMRLFSESLLMSLICFINTYLHAKNQSQIFIH